MTDGLEYDLAFILANPIASLCLKCKRREPIHAPVLDNCRCFHCWGILVPVDPKTYHERVENLWRHVAGPPQLDLFPDHAITSAPP